MCNRRDEIKYFVRSKTSDSASDKPKNDTIEFLIGGKKEKFLVVDKQVEANKFFNQFRTVKGQQIVGGLWIGLSFCAFLYQLGPHTLFQEWVKSLYQSYTKGFPSPVIKEIKSLVHEVKIDMKWQNELDLFVLTLDELRGWGDPGSGMLGFPVYFGWDRVEDVPINTMRFGGGWKAGSILPPSKVHSTEADQFCKSLILTDEAKKFAVARELGRIQGIPHYLMGALNFSWVLLTYNLARHCNRKLELFKKPPIVRGILYLGILPTMIASYLLMKDFAMRFTERRSVKTAISLGPQYARGGMEYYNQLLLRNRCLTVLEPEQSKYNMDGELLQGLLRKKSVPIMELRDLCDNSNVE